MPIWIEYLLTALKASGRFLVNEGTTLPGAYYLVGAAAESIGLHPLAARAYAFALRQGDKSHDRRMFKVRQKWQFALERSYYKQGRPRVTEPLHHCSISVNQNAIVTGHARRSAPGHFQAYWSFRGLVVEGFLRPGASGASIQLLMDGHALREFRAARIGSIFPPFFQVVLQRATVGHFPSRSLLQLRTTDGEGLLYKGSDSAWVHVPHGSSDLQELIRDGCTIDKKGFLRTPGKQGDARSEQLLAAYGEARAAFATSIGRPLLLLYGTLLGSYRDGDLIPGDDDFDVGYVSQHSHPEDVREEAMRIALDLVREGFIISFNRNGRPFRLRLPDAPPDVHLDVHVVWFDHGDAWIHPRARLPCTANDFLPARETQLRGATASIPANPEGFLGQYYGEGWRTPDPSYSTESRYLSRSMKNYLARACFSPVDFQKMQQQLKIDQGTAGPGRLISIGSSSLYPLTDYDANCDW